jgi:hypothetical protein
MLGISRRNHFPSLIVAGIAGVKVRQDLPYYLDGRKQPRNHRSARQLANARKGRALELASPAEGPAKILGERRHAGKQATGAGFR